MIAFVQPFGLGDGSGGARILRALLQDAPHPYLSVCVSARSPSPPPFGQQIHISPHPEIPFVGGTRLAPYAYNFLRPFKSYFAQRFEAQLEDAFCSHGVKAVHAIPHGSQFWQAFQVARRLDIPYYLNVHDDLRYNLAGSPELPRLMDRLGETWLEADGRIVISEAMGEAYNRKYGTRPYEVITDGLTNKSFSSQRVRTDGALRLYFMGALHLSYHPNVRAITEALEQVNVSSLYSGVSFVSRGSTLPIKAPGFPVDQRPYAPESVVQEDFKDVDVLYFPLPFGETYDTFTRYSMSTKLVTYLGSGLPILYHGPRYSAAARLLSSYDAAIIADTNEPDQLAEDLHRAQKEKDRVVANALKLGRDRFWLSDQRHRFWRILGSKMATCSPTQI